MIIFVLTGILLILFAVADFAGMFFGYDLTGVSWSPMVAMIAGSLLMSIGEADEDE